MKYILGFDVETTGRAPIGQMISFSMSLVSLEEKLICQKLFIILPSGYYQEYSGDKPIKNKIDVLNDYPWESCCLKEFGKKNKDILNEVMNTPEDEDTFVGHEEYIATKSRTVFDSLYTLFPYKTYVDNAAFDSCWLSNLWTKYDLFPVEYQKDTFGNEIYTGVNGYSPLARLNKYTNEINLDIFVENDHDPRNDSLRHALIGARIEKHVENLKKKDSKKDNKD